MWCLSPQKRRTGFPKLGFRLELVSSVYLILMVNQSGTILKKLTLKEFIFKLFKIMLTLPN